MLTEAVRNDSAAIARHWAPAILVGVLALTATPLLAQTPVALPPVSLGAGVRTSAVNTMPDGGDSSNGFFLESARFYVNGSPAEKVKLTFNTEYDGPGDHLIVMDAVGQFELSDKVNIWVGRFLPPSDRSNLYGPYYANNSRVYNDGVQDGYPTVAVGRDNGAMWWGQFDKLKLSAGVFDGPSMGLSSKVLTAARAQVDLWDPEGGYYQNGTYYGAKNLLAFGGAVQHQDSNNAYSGDFLLEKKVPGGGAFTVEAEAAKYDKLGGYNAKYGTDTGGYVLGSYLFPPAMGMTGKFQVLGKYAQAKFTNGVTVLNKDYTQKTTEIELNYILNDFKARVTGFFLNTSFDAVQSNFKQVGIALQFQM